MSTHDTPNPCTCGKTPVVFRFESGRHQVICEACHLRGKTGNSPADAVAKWNKGKERS